MAGHIIIGFCGRIGSGKSAIANDIVYNLIVNHRLNAVIFPLAEPMKEIAYNHFGWDGVKDEKGRKLLQVLGTDAGRAYNQQLWIEKLDSRIRSLSDETIVLVDDVRFDNEVDYIESQCGKVFHIIRSGLKNNESHISENGIDYKKNYILRLSNDGSISDVSKIIVHYILGRL